MATYSAGQVTTFSGTGTSITATLATAPGTDKYMLAVAGMSSQTLTSNSWGATALPNSGFLGSAQLYFYLMRGDGVTKSITVTATGAVTGNYTLVLLEIPNFSSLTLPETPYGGSNTATGTSDTFSLGQTVAGNRWVIAAEMLSGTPAAMGVNWGESGSWDEINPSLSVQQRLAVGITQVTSGTDPTASFSWTNSRNSRRGMVVLTQATSGDASPSVSIENPTSGDLVGGFITLEASAADDVSVSSVTFSVDGGAPLAATYNDPYWQYALDTTSLTNTSHTVTATAIDSATQSTTSSSLSFTVNNLAAPTYLYKGSTNINDLYVGASGLGSLYVGNTPLAPVINVPTTTPTSTASFGPNGTHWPENTPLASDTFDYDVEVAPTWTAINTAIATAVSTYPNGKCRIRVQPGNLPSGNGFGSTSAGILSGVGSAARPWRILIAPRDGYGTVGITGTTGVSFVDVKGVSIMGIDLSGVDGVMVRNCQQFAIGRTKIKRALRTANGLSGLNNCEWVECVMGPAATDNVDYDRMEDKTAGGYNIYRNRTVGCYIAPNYKVAGSSGHTDSLQMAQTSGTGTNTYSEIIDTALFQSSNQGLMGSEAPHASYITFNHCLLLGGDRGQIRYPVASGGAVISAANLLWGAISHVTMTNSMVGGSINSGYQFDLVSNSAISSATSATISSGAFTVDSSLNTPTFNATALNTLSPYPDDTYLASIWV